ncbi:MAG: hypothetical protein JWR69_2473 [Pedosphaera sp.]|nr:hypothetical protein [Pedosphaera sp.]
MTPAKSEDAQKTKAKVNKPKTRFRACLLPGAPGVGMSSKGTSVFDVEYDIIILLLLINVDWVVSDPVIARNAGDDRSNQK